LLPLFGGKGMYGDRVHEAVFNAGVNETGITIHFVNEHYDEGAIIFQASVPVEENDNVDSLRRKVQQLEHAHYPGVIEKLISGNS